MQNRELFIDSDGIPVHAKLDFPEAAGEKMPLVIVIPGFTGHIEEEHILAASKAMNELGFATLRAEMYGHGKSGGRFEDHTLYKWLTNAMSVTDYAKQLDFVTDLYLCGHSQGGLLTVLLAAMEKDLFRAILPLSPALSIPDDARRGETLGVTFDPDHIPEMLAYPDGRQLGGNYIRVAQTLDVDRAIASYEGPVFLLHGDADMTVPVSVSVDAAAKYRNAKLVILPGDDHCYEDDLERMAEAVKDFLREYC